MGEEEEGEGGLRRTQRSVKALSIRLGSRRAAPLVNVQPRRLSKPVATGCLSVSVICMRDSEKRTQKHDATAALRPAARCRNFMKLRLARGLFWFRSRERRSRGRWVWERGRRGRASRELHP